VGLHAGYCHPVLPVQHQKAANRLILPAILALRRGVAVGDGTHPPAISAREASVGSPHIFSLAISCLALACLTVLALFMFVTLTVKTFRNRNPIPDTPGYFVLNRFPLVVRLRHFKIRLPVPVRVIGMPAFRAGDGGAELSSVNHMNLQHGLS
jgi:hypothetical protein